MTAAAGDPDTTRMLADLERRLQATLPMARIELQPVPGLAPMQLALINADFPREPLPEVCMRAVLRAPAYWGFCWASGLALARFLLERPDWVRGRTVLDLGPGCGVDAIAAARAGAARVIACDIDPDALAATATNARLNGVAIDCIDSLAALPPGGVDIVLLADVLYDASNRTLLDLIEPLSPACLIADARVKTVDAPGFRPFHSARAVTFPNLDEFDEFRQARFYYRGPADPGDIGVPDADCRTPDDRTSQTGEQQA